ncbi:MAG: ribulose-phosphate 3-epimerase [Candidatus Nealsonbacteria bacterium]|nr:ribulose-phosphate 3-epimerase [Candidatus Nealsonbacteria bacterium]
MNVEIIPAIIAESQEELSEKINRVKSHAKLIQLDVMDGIFVPNKSIDFDFDLPKTGCKFEAHLMLKNPDKWVKNNWEKVSTILIPIESCKNPEELVVFLKNHSTRLMARKVGFALNPETPLARIKDYLDEIDQVLIMTVSPGFYGSKFLPETLEKVRQLRKLKPDLNIEVDGGITPETIKMALEAGANLFVSGSYIFNSQNPQEAIRILSNLIR